MNNKVKHWKLTGAIITVVFGSLLHFMYDWLGRSTIAAIISPVNESPWEHLKLLFIPMLVFGIIEYFAYGKTDKGFLFSKVAGIVVGIATILIIFYTYSGIIGDSFLPVDIATFIFAVLLAYYVDYKLLISDKGESNLCRIASAVVLLILITAFVVFTFNPPHIPVFQDPNSGSYTTELLPKN